MRRYGGNEQSLGERAQVKTPIEAVAVHFEKVVGRFSGSARAGFFLSGMTMPVIMPVMDFSQVGLFAANQ